MVTWGGRELPFSSDVSVVVVVYKVTIEVNEPQESLQFFNSAWSWPFCDCSDLCNVQLYTLVTDIVTKESGVGGMKRTFLL